MISRVGSNHKEGTMLEPKAMTFTICVALLGTCLSVHAQGSVTPAVPALLSKLKSTNSSGRIEAFYQLLPLLSNSDFSGRMNAREGRTVSSGTEDHGDDSVTLALADLLVRENSFVQSHQFVSQDFAEYYGDLISSVSSLKDVRTSDALLGAISTGDMATRALAGFGPDVLDRVITQLSSSHVLVRNGATRVLSEMLDEPKISKGNRDYSARIETALVIMSADENAYVRISAIEGLGKLADSSATATIERAALNDGYEASAHGGSPGVFPVREAARQVLQRLSERSK